MLEYIGSLGGIAGIMAFLMFIVYRADRKTSEANLTRIIEQAQEKEGQREARETEIVRAYNATCHEHTEAMKENTKIQTELIVWLKARNGNK